MQRGCSSTSKSSPEAQLVYGAAGFPPAVSGIEDKIPEKARAAANVPLLDRQDLEGQEERMALAAKIYLGK